MAQNDTDIKKLSQPPLLSPSSPSVPIHQQLNSTSLTT
jgi:hypothetical protein